jgi:Uma2 family endonuclease
MIDAGVLTPRDRVQLIEGQLVPMAPIGSQHAVAVELLEKALDKILPKGWTVRAQQPITLKRSEPQPDIVVARGEVLDYSDRHPYPDDIAWVIEVADATLTFDRHMAGLYATAGIPRYGVLNLFDRQFELYLDPQPPKRGRQRAYVSKHILLPSDVWQVVLTQRKVGTLKVTDLFPRSRSSRP